MLVCGGAAVAPRGGDDDELVLAEHPVHGGFLRLLGRDPLWRMLTRWDAEMKAKHAEIAATAVAEPVIAQPAPATAPAHGTGSLAYAGVGDPLGL